MEKEFTVEQGLKIQAEQLAEWKTILKPEVYTRLEKWATKFNKYATKGEHITRGCDFSNFTGNIMLGHADNKITQNIQWQIPALREKLK